MTIQPLGFLDTSAFTAAYVAKYKKSVEDGILNLRDARDDGEVTALGVLKEWNSARALLQRLRAAAAPFFDGVTPELGKAWVEVLPPRSGTPWVVEEGDYALTHVRTRTCLIPSPGAISYCGASFVQLAVGTVNQIDHRQLCSEVNLGEHTRVHLVVDVRVPNADDAET